MSSDIESPAVQDDFRYGSKPDMDGTAGNVRSTPPTADVRVTNVACPLWARSGRSEVGIAKVWTLHG